MRRWKPISGYEDYYEVSDDGLVRSVDRAIIKSNGVTQYRCGKVKALRKDKDGYLTVGLSKDGYNKKYRVHFLVAREFVDGYKEGLEVNHKDFDRTNNRYYNLEWAEHVENIKYSSVSGRYKIRNFTGLNNPNYGNTTLRERYANDKALSKIKNSRQGSKNGRSRPIRMFICEDEYMDFDYMIECANYMIENHMVRSTDAESVSAYISSAASNNKPYFGYRFNFL